MLASLKIIGRLHWIDREKLRSFILACQDEETGGFADRPGDMASISDVHTIVSLLLCITSVFQSYSRHRNGWFFQVLLGNRMLF